MPSGFHNWSQTAGANATADATVNWAEGQSPSSVNDSSRAMMAVLAKWRDDISGAITTGGTSTAYTVASYSVFSTLALMNNQVIGFTPHTTNGATVTLNVDGLGAKPLRAFPGVELQSNTLIAGTPYVAIYNSSSAVFYLQGNAGDIYGIPLGGGLEYWGATTPSSAFVFPTGQAVSRSTYATLFTLFSTTYGVGDGSTTFNLPDPTGRIRAIKEATATRLTTAGGGVDGATLGATGGAQNRTVLQANLPNVNFTITATTTSSDALGSTTATLGGGPGTLDHLADKRAAGVTFSTTGTAASGGSGTALMTVMPTIICNYILRIM